LAEWYAPYSAPTNITNLMKFSIGGFPPFLASAPDGRHPGRLFFRVPVADTGSSGPQLSAAVSGKLRGF
jgi:hypothetical protein